MLSPGLNQAGLPLAVYGRPCLVNMSINTTRGNGFAGVLSDLVYIAIVPQASRKACVMCSLASVITSPLLQPLRMGMCSCGTSAGRTAMRGCSQLTMGLFSAVTGIQRTGMYYTDCPGSVLLCPWQSLSCQKAPEVVTSHSGCMKTVRCGAEYLTVTQPSPEY